MFFYLLCISFVVFMFYLAEALNIRAKKALKSLKSLAKPLSHLIRGDYKSDDDKDRTGPCPE